MPGDLSSATFWAVAAAALPGSDVEIDGCRPEPPRAPRSSTCCAAPARTWTRADTRRRTASRAARSGSAHGDAAAAGRRARRKCPALIDELPALAAMATYGGELHVTGAAELRVKESDRISALAAGFRALGGEIDEFPDGFHVRGRRRLTRRHRRRRRRSPPGDGVRHRRASAPSGPSPHHGRRGGRRLVPRFLRRRWPADRVKADKVYLVGLHGAPARRRWRARWPPARLARRRHRRAHRGAGGPHDRVDLRARRRTVFPRRRARGAPRSAAVAPRRSSPPAAARSSTPRTAPPSIATGSRSGSTCRSRSDRSPARRRSAAAGGGPRRSSSGCIAARRAGVPAGPPPARRRAAPRRRPGRAGRGRIGRRDMRYLVLSDIHGNLEALDAVLAAVEPRGYDATLVLGDLVGYGADPNAVIDRVRGLDAARASSAATTTRSPPAWRTRRASTPSRAARSAGRCDALTPENTRLPRGAAGGPDRRRRLDRDLPRDALRRGRLRLRRARRVARARVGQRPRVPVRPHAHPGRLHADAATDWMSKLPDGEPALAGDDRRRSSLPDQSRIRRTAARRRSTRGVRDRGHRPHDAWNFGGFDYPSPGHTAESACGRACPTFWRGGSPVGR